MRFSLIGILLLVTALAGANPRPIVQLMPLPPAPAYLSSERLTVNVSPTNASFAGVFTFAVPERVWQGFAEGCYISLPVWLPASGLGKAVAVPLQQVAKAQNHSHIKRLQKALALSVDPLPAPGYVPGVQLDSNGAVAAAAALAGFQTVSFSFDLPPKVLKAPSTPVTIAYRQPSLLKRASGEFFYLPILDDLPKSISSTDTNRYLIIIRAEPGCSLTFTNGEQICTLHPGESAVCSPRHLQPIRGRAWPDAKPPVQRTGTSRSAQEPAQPLLAAGSGR